MMEFLIVVYVAGMIVTALCYRAGDVKLDGVRVYGWQRWGFVALVAIIWPVTWIRETRR